MGGLGRGGFLGGAEVKNPPADAGDVRDTGSVPGSGRYPGGGHGNPLQYLPGEARGQRSLEGYSPEGCKESDTTEATKHACTYTPEGRSYHLLSAAKYLVTSEAVYLPKTSCKAGGVRFEFGSV